MAVSQMIKLDPYRDMASRFMHVFRTFGAEKLPDSREKDILKFFFSDDNSERDLTWSVTGLKDTLELYVYVMNCARNLPDDCRDHFIEISALYMSKYLFEGLTDNLAINLIDIEDNRIGVSKDTPLSDAYYLFNKIAVERLEGKDYDTTKALQSLKTVQFDIMKLGHINTHRLKAVLSALPQQKSGKNDSSGATNFSPYAWCVANIDACLGVNEILRGHPLQPYVVDNCRRRYAGVCKLLKGDISSREELMTYRGSEILAGEDIVARIAYVEKFSGANLGFANAVEEISEAAICLQNMNRLVNDFGNLMLIDITKVRELFASLRKFQLAHPDIITLKGLFEAWPYSAEKMSRLSKDALLSEMNMSFIWKTKILPHEQAPQNLTEKIDIIAQEVEYWNHIYKETEARMMDALHYIDYCTANHIVYDFMRGYIDFNIAMYTVDYTKSDYLI